MPRRHVVALVHGIRTEAGWGELVKSVLERDAAVSVEVLRYGYFDVLRFLFPFGMRTSAIKEIQEKLEAIQFYDRDCELSIIAHSFGTYIVASILRREPFFRMKRLVFCGSVVDRRFRWAEVSHKIAEDKVLNDCGTKDVWPVLAHAATFGYGPTGTFGFGDPKVRDRFHALTHSDYFNSAFVEEFWVPYIGSGTISGTAWELSKGTPPTWMSLLGWVPSRWLIWGTPIAGLLWMAYLVLRRLSSLG